MSKHIDPVYAKTSLNGNALSVGILHLVSTCDTSKTLYLLGPATNGRIHKAYGSTHIPPWLHERHGRTTRNIIRSDFRH